MSATILSTVILPSTDKPANVKITIEKKAGIITRKYDVRVSDGEHLDAAKNKADCFNFDHKALQRSNSPLEMGLLNYFPEHATDVVQLASEISLRNGNPQGEFEVDVSDEKVLNTWKNFKEVNCQVFNVSNKAILTCSDDSAINQRIQNKPMISPELFEQIEKAESDCLKNVNKGSFFVKNPNALAKETISIKTTLPSSNEEIHVQITPTERDGKLNYLYFEIRGNQLIEIRENRLNDSYFGFNCFVVENRLFMMNPDLYPKYRSDCAQLLAEISLHSTGSTTFTMLYNSIKPIQSWKKLEDFKCENCDVETSTMEQLENRRLVSKDKKMHAYTMSFSGNSPTEERIRTNPMLSPKDAVECNLIKAGEESKLFKIPTPKEPERSETPTVTDTDRTTLFEKISHRIIKAVTYIFCLHWIGDLLDFILGEETTS